MRRWAVRIIVGLPILLVVLWLLLPNANWDGAVPREVRLRVVDGAAGSPVANAVVNFRGRPVGVTDANGNVRWTALFGAGGSTNIIARGHWSIDGEVAITDRANRSTTVALERLVRNPRPTLWNKGPVRATVKHGS